MRLFSYVIARDYGFAPNPFHGVCTLAVCKPVIRRVAQVGDWIVGTGSVTKGRRDHLVFAMQVSETLLYNEYWSDSRFHAKRPNLRGSIKQAYGDNIYHRISDDQPWQQEDSHHSLSDGQVNMQNVEADTRTDRVLIAEDFVYLGSSGLVLPEEFRKSDSVDFRAGRGHRSNYPETAVQAMLAWLESLPRGYRGRPIDW
jgi:hypothetical protein